MRIDIDWQAGGDGRSWRTVWDRAGMELGRIECGNGGYRWAVNGEAGPWQDRFWEAVAGLKAAVKTTGETRC
jgi:hypothetical protein